MAGDETACGSLILVGCGKMGTAMLRGWIAGNAASRFLVVEPEGAPPGFPCSGSVAWHTEIGTLPDALVPDAVIFAVKPQVVDTVVPLYQCWVRPQTVFISIVAGKNLTGFT